MCVKATMSRDLSTKPKPQRGKYNSKIFGQQKAIIMGIDVLLKTFTWIKFIVYYHTTAHHNYLCIFSIVCNSILQFIQNVREMIKKFCVAYEWFCELFCSILTLKLAWLEVNNMKSLSFLEQEDDLWQNFRAVCHFGSLFICTGEQCKNPFCAQKAVK